MREISNVVVHSPGHVEHSEDQIAGIVIDSLVAIEARNWARKTIWLEIPMSALSKVKTVGELTKCVVEGLKAKYSQGRREDA